MRILLRIAPLLLIIAASGTLAADWTRQGSTPDVNFYLDLNSIKKNGNLRRVWQLQDRNSPSKTGARSLRAMSEYDCKEDKYRTLQLDTFSGAMAEGEIISTDSTPGQWAFIAPGTPFANTLKLVCFE